MILQCKRQFRGLFGGRHGHRIMQQRQDGPSMGCGNGLLQVHVDRALEVRDRCLLLLLVFKRVVCADY